MFRHFLLFCLTSKHLETYLIKNISNFIKIINKI